MPPKKAKTVKKSKKKSAAPTTLAANNGAESTPLTAGGTSPLSTSPLPAAPQSPIDVEDEADFFKSMVAEAKAANEAVADVAKTFQFPPLGPKSTAADCVRWIDARLYDIADKDTTGMILRYFADSRRHMVKVCRAFEQQRRDLPPSMTMFFHTFVTGSQTWHEALTALRQNLADGDIVFTAMRALNTLCANEGESMPDFKARFDVAWQQAIRAGVDLQDSKAWAVSFISMLPIDVRKGVASLASTNAVTIDSVTAAATWARDAELNLRQAGRWPAEPPQDPCSAATGTRRDHSPAPDDRFSDDTDGPSYTAGTAGWSHHNHSWHD